MATNRPGLVHEITFNSGTNPYAYDLHASGNGTAKIVDVAGERAVQTSLNHYSDSTSYRTELEVKGLPSDSFTKNMCAKYGEEYWYGLRVYMPENWEKDSSPEIITQFHTFPDENLGEGWRSPPVSLIIKPGNDGKSHFFVNLLTDRDAYTPGGGSSGADQNTYFDLGPIDAAVGKWTDWVWNIKWAYDDSGNLTLYRDGKVALDLPNQPNTYNDATGPYMKFGVYKWPWQSGTDTGADSRNIYFDDLRIAKGAEATYESVAPTTTLGGGSTGGGTTNPTTPTTPTTPVDNALKGTSGADTLSGDASANVIYGYGGNDKLYGGNGNDQVLGGVGDDRVYGGNGHDILRGEDGKDILYGGSGTDSLFGDAGSDILYGEDNDDKLSGGLGIDTLYGGTGNDILNGDEDGDVLYGGYGMDTLNGGLGNDALYGESNNDVLNGDNGSDKLYGNDGNDMLFGGADQDWLYGGAGNDVLHGDAGNDIVSGEAGHDTLFGDAGMDTLYGGDGNDILMGGSESDLLFGGAGDDMIYTGAGNDTLSGGAGADRFKMVAGGGSDIITDFQIGTDKIDFSELDISASEITRKADAGGVMLSVANAGSVYLKGIAGKDLTTASFVL